ncbi:MAG TPA: helix-turn-helix transcriptional regulator [Mycobacteriales bacterium]|jgi:transcriptional regulator with XRE-family HTH domain|nr:helix-turn-helix transcriptional regulator [Mycobacteriales bacterium]
MSDPHGATLGERVAELRTRRDLSQRELAAEVGRSESWVSQVERNVIPVERVPVLQALADALGVTVRDLRPEATAAADADRTRRPATDLDTLRLVLTGHPAPELLLGTTAPTPVDVQVLTERVRRAWVLTHASAFGEVNAELIDLLPDLERAWRQSEQGERELLGRLLADAYQAASAAFARLDEADASWIAADRSIAVAEQSGDPLGAFAGLFRMAHAFITLRHLDQAEQVVSTGIEALAPAAESDDASPAALSVYGALHVTLAVIHARGGQRTAARAAIAQGRAIAARIGEDRNDYETEFGPTNVELHAVAVAVDLGDAGEALDLAAGVDTSGLSSERQARMHIDMARAHAQRRHVGEAVRALLTAESLAPEQVHTSAPARQLLRDLVALAGRRIPQELVDLTHRSAVI